MNSSVFSPEKFRAVPRTRGAWPQHSPAPRASPPRPSTSAPPPPRPRTGRTAAASCSTCSRWRHAKASTRAPAMNRLHRAVKCSSIGVPGNQLHKRRLSNLIRHDNWIQVLEEHAIAQVLFQCLKRHLKLLGSIAVVISDNCDPPRSREKLPRAGDRSSTLARATHRDEEHECSSAMKVVARVRTREVAIYTVS